MHDEIEDKRSALRKACADANTILIEASISNDERVPSFYLEFSNFLKTLRAEQPRVVFLYEAAFDADQAIEDKVADAFENRIENDDEFDAEVARIGEIVRKKLLPEIELVKNKNGSIRYFVARYADHLAFRVTADHAVWALEFEGRLSDEVEVILNSMDSDEEAAANTKKTQDQLATQRAVETLMNDPEFRKLKGLPKRQEYVSWKYPDLVPSHRTGQTARLQPMLPKIDANLAEAIRTAHLRITITDKAAS